MAGIADVGGQRYTNAADGIAGTDLATVRQTVAPTGHANESALASITGAVVDIALTPSTVLGRLSSGDVVAVPFSSIVSGGGGSGGITALTSDVTASGPGSAAATIAAGAVTNAKRANMAASTLSGNATGSPAGPTDLTAAAVKTLLAISFADISGAIAAAQFPGLTGDVTTALFVATIAAKAVTFAKMQDIPTLTLIGRQAAGAGVPTSVGVTGNLEFDGSGNIRRAAMTGDVISSAGSAGTVLQNIPNDTTMAGDILGTAIAAPGTPAAGKVRIYPDSASKTFAAKNDAGIVTHMVQTFPSTTNQVLFAIDDDGTVHGVQLAFFNLSGSVAGAQLPSVTGSVDNGGGGSASLLFSSVAGNTIIANPSSSPARPSAQSVSTIRSMLTQVDPPYLDLFFSWGNGDGNNTDSTLPSSIGPGMWPFWLLPNAKNSDIPGQPYSGTAVDANLVTPAMVTEWMAMGSFTQAWLKVYVSAWLPVSGGSLDFRLSRGGLIDASTLTLSVSGTGVWDTGITALGGFTFSASDRAGLRALPGAGMTFGANKAKFTAHLRLLA